MDHGSAICGIVIVAVAIVVQADLQWAYDLLNIVIVRPEAVRSISTLKLPVMRISAPEDVLTSIVINSVCTEACLRLDFPTGIEAACIKPDSDIIGMN